MIFLSGCEAKKGAPDAPMSPVPEQPPVQLPPSSVNKDVDFKYFGVIREFGGTDNAALFGLLPDSGKLEITEVKGPEFLKVYQIGQLTEATIAKLFVKGSKPLNANEKSALLASFNGATVIYTESYAGNICNLQELIYNIRVLGKVDETPVDVTFQIEALPNANGNCGFHRFGIISIKRN